MQLPHQEGGRRASGKGVKAFWERRPSRIDSTSRSLFRLSDGP